MPRISPRSAFAPCDISVQAHASFPAGLARPRPGRQGGWAAALLATVVFIGLPGCAAVDSVMAPPPVEPKVATPAPTYASAEAAQGIADAAKAERAAAVDAYTARVRDCMHTFFATRCADKAREERNTITERADVTRQQAELFVRQEKARVHRESLAAENARRDARDAEAAAARQAEAAQRPAPRNVGPAAASQRRPGADAGAAPPAGAMAPSAGSRSPAASASPSNAPAASGPARAPAAASTGPASRAAPGGASISPAEQADNRAAFEKKQAEAKAYAEKRAEERKENEDKRERRRAAREADAAKFNTPAATPATPPTQGK